MHSELSRPAFRSVVRLALGLLLLIAASAPLSAETKPATPFGVPVPAQNGPPAAFSPPQAAPPRASGPFGALMSWVTETQQEMQRELAASGKRLKSGNAVAAALALAGLSFLYGVVHAVGPEHGKAIISSYVVANEEMVKRGVMISFLAAAMQAVTAVVLVGVLLIALNTTGLQLNVWSNQLESVSYALIALVGLYFLTSQVLRLWRRFGDVSAGEAAHSHTAHAHTAPGNPGHDHHHHHHHDHAHAHAHREDCGHVVDARKLADPFSWRKVAAVVFSVGIRPCTGAILVLVFALTQGLF